MKTASWIIGRDLPCFEILYQQRLLGRVTLISQDSFHPAMTYLNLFHLVADSDPSKPGPTALVLAFSPSLQALSKQKWFFSHPQQTHIPVSDKFLVCIFYHNLLCIILFHILHFKLIYFYQIVSITYRCYKDFFLFRPFYVIVLIY